jgi:hypothetical protein
VIGVARWGDARGRGARRLLQRKPRPGDIAGEAQLVEPLRVVVDDAHGQDISLPRHRRDFEPLQLCDRFENATLAFEPPGAGHVLPHEEIPHEVLRRHRLDLATEAVEREAVNASEKPPVAPLFHLRIRRE